MNWLILKFLSILTSLGLKKWPAPLVYCAFIKGNIPASRVYEVLDPNHVEEFILLHEQTKKALEDGKDELPPAVIFSLTHIFLHNRRHLDCALMQVDALIEKDLEKNIFKKKLGKNVVMREN